MSAPSGGRVVTVGTFDGVHRGHWEVLRELSRVTAERGARSTLVTFDPHPLRIVRPDAAPALLTTPAEKMEILAQSEVEHVALLRFTPELAALSPRAFVERILLQRLGMTHFVIGYDHGFGRGRSGDVDTLRRIGGELGFSVDVVPPVQTEGGAISSSRIRDLLVAGDARAAADGLGRPYAITGTVVRGAGQGRTLGVPTANIEVAHPHKLIPREGIYAARAALRDRLLDGVLHVGPRPTFAGLPSTIEVHLFDFDGEIYGERLRLDFVERIRDVVRFPTVDALVEAMGQDCARAREVLRGGVAGEPPFR